MHVILYSQTQKQYNAQKEVNIMPLFLLGFTAAGILIVALKKA